MLFCDRPKVLWLTTAADAVAPPRSGHRCLFFGEKKMNGKKTYLIKEKNPIVAGEGLLKGSDQMEHVKHISPLVEIRGDSIEMETDNGILIIQSGHTFGFVGHKHPVLASIDGQSTYALKKQIETHNDGYGNWQGFMDNKQMFTSLVRLGILYNNNKRWHINQDMIVFTDEESIHDWNSNSKPMIYTGVDERTGSRIFTENTWSGVTCIGDPKHALNKLHYLSRKKKENLIRYKTNHPAPKGSYFWLKQNIKSCEYAKPDKQLCDKFIFKVTYKDDNTEYISMYKGAVYSSQQKDYIYTAKYLYRLAEQSRRTGQKHETYYQKDAQGKYVNPMVWQPSRQEVYTELTGADILNSKIRESRGGRKICPKRKPEPIITDEEKTMIKEDRERARNRIYKYKQQKTKQKKNAHDNRTDTEKLYDQVFDRLGYKK